MTYRLVMTLGYKGLGRPVWHPCCLLDCHLLRYLGIPSLDVTFSNSMIS